MWVISFHPLTDISNIHTYLSYLILPRNSTNILYMFGHFHSLFKLYYHMMLVSSYYILTIPVLHVHTA